jgi:effector-binding domain-containing protein
MRIGASYGKMCAYLAELGEAISDMPYVAYFNQDMNALQVEIGFPVAKPLPAGDGIKAGTIPEGLVAFCIYRGAYGDMVQTYGELHEWITQNGYAPTGTAYEHYFNGPNFPESELLTMISMPVTRV